MSAPSCSERARYYPAVEVLRPDDPRAFLTLAEPLLARDTDAEARHNLMLGIAGTIAKDPTLYPRFHLWVVVDDEGPVAAALQTPPHNLVVADPASDRALDVLLDAVRAEGLELPGVVGNVPHVHPTAARLAAAAGRTARVALRQGVYALTALHRVPETPGGYRAATRADRGLLMRWLTAFGDEAFAADDVGSPNRDRERLSRILDARLADPDSNLWFWEDADQPVSLAGSSGRTPSGIRVGPVYTPPEHRRRGYATALVAALTAWLLEQGHRTCFLYTDLANPTSNAIYERIGYERVCEAVEYRFGSA